MPASQAPVYDRIGGRYATGRRTDPRVAAPILAALSGARTVLNVGAGSGSYEPRGPRVAAVEPSVVMIAQRPRDAAPAVRAVAEALPFRDGTFDAALGVLTMHHWADRDRGLAEMRRVARPLLPRDRAARGRTRDAAHRGGTGARPAGGDPGADPRRLRRRVQRRVLAAPGGRPGSGGVGAHVGPV